MPAILNSFGTVDGLKTYAASYVLDAPDLTNDDDTIIALNQATQILDTLVYIDEAVSKDHAFPRTVIGTPDNILAALYEVAIKVLKGDDIESATDAIGVTSVGIANVRIAAKAEVSQAHLAHGVISTIAWRLIQPYLRVDRDLQLSRVS